MLVFEVLAATVLGSRRAARGPASQADASTLVVGGTSYAVTHVDQVKGLSDADLGGTFRNPRNVPYLTAFAGDPEVIHVMGSPGSESGHVFSLGGVSWPQDSNISDSNLLTSQGLGAWETFTLVVDGGAGGRIAAPGDFFYGDLRRPFTAVGLWGLQRVLPRVPDGTGGCPIRRVDASIC